MMKIGVLALYALMMVAVIVLTARKKLSLNEFLLGGRNVGPWLSALSYGPVISARSSSWATRIDRVDGRAVRRVVRHRQRAGGKPAAWKLLARPTRRMGEKLGTATIPASLKSATAAGGCGFWRA